MENNKISSLEVGALSTFIYKAFILIGGINLLLSINKNYCLIWFWMFIYKARRTE